MVMFSLGLLQGLTMRKKNTVEKVMHSAKTV